jgi:hypothetical protein
MNKVCIVENHKIGFPMLYESFQFAIVKDSRGAKGPRVYIQNVLLIFSYSCKVGFAFLSVVGAGQDGL